METAPETRPDTTAEREIRQAEADLRQAMLANDVAALARLIVEELAAGKRENGGGGKGWSQFAEWHIA